MDCLFCKIVRREIPAEVVYEDSETLAFLDVNPRAPGHTLVVPKGHFETILDLPNQAIGPLFGTVKKIEDSIVKALAPDGFTIGINQRRVAGQVVDHLHIHIFPRFLNDGGGSVHSVLNNPPKESIEEIASRIRSRQ